MGKQIKEEFIEKARKIHGDKYDYSKVEYVNSKTKVCIICPEHGEFWQIHNAHLKGQGCPKCGIIKMSLNRTLTKEQFIEKAKNVHGDKYDYSKVEYVDAHTKVCIICPEHGEFWQSPNSHLNGCGCGKCAKNILLNNDEFIERSKNVHGDKYDYSKVEYVNGHTKVCIICPEHGEFWQDPYAHMYGQKCPKCSNRERLTTEQWINKAKAAHGDKYDYSKVQYVNNHTKVCIVCPLHGEFWQNPNNHVSQKRGCNKCNSSGNTELVNILEKSLKKRNIVYERERTFEWLKRYKHMYLDFYLPDYNIAIECHGVQHFYPQDKFGGEKMFNEISERDILKRKLCLEHEIKVFYFAKKDYKYFTKIYTDDNLLIEEICKK